MMVTPLTYHQVKILIISMIVTPLTESSKPEMPMPDAAAVPAKPMKWPELVIIVEIMMSYKYAFNYY